MNSSSSSHCHSLWVGLLLPPPLASARQRGRTWGAAGGEVITGRGGREAAVGLGFEVAGMGALMVGGHRRRGRGRCGGPAVVVVQPVAEGEAVLRAGPPVGGAGGGGQKKGRIRKDRVDGWR